MSADRYQPLILLGSRASVRVWLGVLRGAAGYLRPVVLKQALDGEGEAGAEARADLLREARLAAALHHPNLVHPFELVEAPKGLLLSMEYVPGVSLSTLVRHLSESGAAVPWPVASRIVADAARGLAHAHEALDWHGRPLDVVHRDVSPKNILVAEEGWSKVLDFGIARSALATATHGSLVRGTLGYLSPEQACGESIDWRSDVFSLGVVLCELVTGERPFHRPTLDQMLEAILNAPPPPLPSETPAVIGDLLARMLARDPAHRTVPMREVADVLEEAAGQHGAGHGMVATFLRAELGPQLRRRRRRLARLIDAGPGETAAAPDDLAPSEPTATLELLEQVLDVNDALPASKAATPGFADAAEAETVVDPKPPWS
jgi:serine/threonine-protein kinase